MNEQELISRIIKNRYANKRTIITLLQDFLLLSRYEAIKLYEEKILPKLDYIPKDKAGCRSKIGNKHRSEILRDYKDGITKKEIEKKYNVAYTTIVEILDEAGVY